MKSCILQLSSMSSNHEISEARREAKWQFRRRLLLEAADILETQPDKVWPQVEKTLELLRSSSSPSIRHNTKRWLRFAGNSPEKTKATIKTFFTPDTPEGPKRHKLQDLSDGHPFTGILSGNTRGR